MCRVAVVVSAADVPAATLLSCAPCGCTGSSPLDFGLALHQCRLNPWHSMYGMKEALCTQKLLICVANTTPKLLCQAWYPVWHFTSTTSSSPVSIGWMDNHSQLLILRVQWACLFWVFCRPSFIRSTQLHYYLPYFTISYWLLSPFQITTPFSVTREVSCVSKVPQQIHGRAQAGSTFSFLAMRLCLPNEILFCTGHLQSASHQV
jgi:hypothetical protein